MFPKNVLVQRSKYSGKKTHGCYILKLASDLERKVRKGDKRVEMLACNYLQQTEYKRKSKG